MSQLGFRQKMILLISFHRAQYAMFMALTDYKPIYIRGPIYTGKTTVVKTMSIRLGRLLVNKLDVLKQNVNLTAL